MTTKPAPGIIRKLEEGVINRIAAGEVIQRPANALKELIENSIDAGSKNIQVLTKSGGMKLLQIQDDGCGIRREDLPIACERFTTSKLKVFEDLQTIQTYGFRGEALASISHVAHLTILTKTEGSVCAYRAEYLNGKLADKGKANPQACAGNLGTTIIVENLFYNIESRRRSLTNTGDEHNRILEVVNRYSIHNYRTGFSLKKYGENSYEMRTPPNSTVIDNIRVLYGVEVARELVPVSCESALSQFKMSGFVSNGNYSLKKASFILFINNRLVESAGLKKVLEGIYLTYLPKGSHPFIYLSLDVDPRNVDVNIHPTKQEVHFLHEDVIIAEIGNAIDKVLQGSNQSRTFYIQSLLPTASPNTTSDPKKSYGEKRKSSYDCPNGKYGSDTQVAPKHLVRTDPKERTLDTFLATSSSSLMKRTPETTRESTATEKKTSPVRQRRVINLDSVKNLCDEIHDRCHTDLMTAFRNHTFVGCVNRTHALIQYDTKLYMVNTVMKSKELFYQKMMLNFGNIGCLQFEDPIPVQELIKVALKETEVGEAAVDVIDEMSLDIAAFLQTKADMLSDYFSVQISSTGTLDGIPLLLDNYLPCMELVPFYLVNLAKRVNWESETECFKTFCQETAHFYAIPPGDDADNEEQLLTGQTWKWTIEHVIYPELKKSLIPQKLPSGDATIIELADLPNLYKVFERC